MSFTDEQIIRYSRNILLSEVGGSGQKKLLSAKVLIVGAGGLGSPAAYYLAAAGVGTLGLIDNDAVDLSNLQRQILHSSNDIGRPKTDSAREKLVNLNSDCQIVSYPERLTAANASNIIGDYDIVIDGTDNYETRFLINDTCIAHGKPFVHGGVLRFFGQVTTIVPGQGPCFHCIFSGVPAEDSVQTCAQVGVLGVIAGVIGCLQATEVLKYLLGQGDLLVGRLLTYDALTMTFQEVEFKKNPHCSSCGGR